MCLSHTELLLLVTAVSTVILLVAQQAGVDAVAVCTAEPGWHLTGDVHWQSTHKEFNLLPVYIIRTQCCYL